MNNVGNSDLSKRAHDHDDVDLSKFAHHHTLGPSVNQAAPGNHTHPAPTPVPMLTWTANASADTSLLTDTYVDLTGATVTVTADATTNKFLVVVAADLRHTTADTQGALVALNLDTVVQTGVVQSVANLAQARITHHQHYLVTGLSVGIHVLKLQGRVTVTSGGTWIAGQTNTRITVTKLEAIGLQGPTGSQGPAGNSGIFDVHHGTNPSVARPTGYAKICWFGTSTPANALPTDFWVKEDI